MPRDVVRPIFESLESRQLLSSISFDDGILTISGYTNTGTVITIPADWHKMTINGSLGKKLPAIMAKIGSAALKMVRITTYDFADKIVIDPSLRFRTYINTGSGNDTVLTGAGEDTIFGGAGNDAINAGTSKNKIFAGSGNDTIQGMPADTVWTQGGNDKLIGVNAMDGRAYQTVTSSTQSAEFSMLSNLDPLYGFDIDEVIVADLTPVPGGQPIVGANRTLPMNLVSSVGSGSVYTRVWATADNSVVATVKLKSSSTTRSMQITLVNNGTARIISIDYKIPWVSTPVGPNHAILSPDHGGVELPWPTNGFTQQNASYWPGYAYSPTAVFFDKSTTEGVGFTAINNRLDSTLMFWVLSSSRAAPYVRILPNLDAGQSECCNVELFHSWNMPTQQYTHYRQAFLEPFMASLGIPEADYHKTGVWGTANWVNPGDTLSSVISRAIGLGASGFFQYSPADGATPHYEPFQTYFPWADQVLAASKIAGLQGFGVLINPYISQRYPDGNGGYYQNDQYLNDPAVQQLLRTQRDALLARGVNFAFWDTGTVPRNGTGLDWLNVLWGWKRVGITIAAENACDIASWICGAVLNDGYGSGDLGIWKSITPHSTHFVVQAGDGTVNVNGQSMFWWDAASKAGFVPILTEDQLRERLAELGL